MNSNELIALKRKESEKVKEQYGFPKKNKAIGLIHIEDTALLKGVLEGLEVLPVNFFVLSSEKLSKLPKNVEVLSTLDIKGEAIDFVVCDDCEGNLPDLLKKGVAPVVPRDHHLATLLSEFNPIKNEGNAFLFENTTKWDIFYGIARYLENFKFPFDNKNLVKNVFEI